MYMYIHALVYLLSFSLSHSAIGRLPITICIRDPRTGAAGPCLDAVRKELFVKPGCEKFQLTTNVYAEDCTYIVHVYHTCMYMSGCVGRVGMPQKIFNPPPQFSRLGTLCPTLVCSFHGMGFLSPPFCLFASVLYTYNTMYNT